ncbi:RNA polymerase sigma factor [Gemmatimonadota bacterium]
MLKNIADDASSPIRSESRDYRVVELRMEEPWPETMDEFKVMVRNYQNCLVRFAFHRLGNLQDSEDVVQGVFAKAYKDRGKQKNVRRLKPYLYRMVVNACVDLLRSRGPDEISLEDLPPGGVGSDRNGAETREAALEIERIGKLISCLPAKQAEVVRLLIIDRIGPTDAAEMLECSVNTVKSRFRYGIKKLRRKMISQRRLRQ